MSDRLYWAIGWICATIMFTVFFGGIWINWHNATVQDDKTEIAEVKACMASTSNQLQCIQSVFGYQFNGGSSSTSTTTASPSTTRAVGGSASSGASTQ